MKFEKKWAAAALVVAVVALPLLVRGCRGDSAKQVELVAVESRAITPTILAPGTLAYRNEVNLTSEITGRVASIAIQEGDEVREGQVLLSLDPEIYRNAVDRAEAGVRLGRLVIDRQQNSLAFRQRQYDQTWAVICRQMNDLYK